MMLSVRLRDGWPKGITTWEDCGTGYMSIPFTWLLPEAQRMIDQGHLWIEHWVVGGPATLLMPGYLEDCGNCEVWPTKDGVLQEVNPAATRSTIGCPRRCSFCGVGQRLIEGPFRELNEWPNLPVVCDSNLLAASQQHVDRVIDGLLELGWADFNQGLDARLLTPHHARRLAEIPKVTIRLALDTDAYREAVADAVATLRAAGIAKAKVRVYVLVGITSPEGDRARCEYVEGLGVKPLPMWFHRLDALEYNAVTPEQKVLGWTKRKQRELMCWYYWHRTLESRG